MNTHVLSFSLFLFAVGLLGCEHYPIQRVESLAVVQNRIQVIRSTGEIAFTGESRKVLRNMRFDLLEFPTDGQKASLLIPIRYDNASLGIENITYNEGTRVDFLLGGYANRMVRVVRELKTEKVKTRVAVLGVDNASDKWHILRQWEFLDKAAQRSVIGTRDGRFLLFSDPSRMLDTLTLTETPAKEFASCVQDSMEGLISSKSDCFLSEDLSHVLIWNSSQTQEHTAGVSSILDLVIDLKSKEKRSQLQVPENASGNAAILHWEDWKQKSFESQFQYYSYDSPVGPNLRSNSMAWDAKRHRSVVKSNVFRNNGALPIVYQSNDATSLVYLNVISNP